MLILALITPVRTDPEPTILAILNSLNEELAHLVRRRLLVALLTHHDRLELLLVPIRARLLLLVLLLLGPRIRIQIPLLRFPLHRQVVRELALLPLLAVPLLEEYAHHRLGVHAKGDLLDLRGFGDQGFQLPLGGLGGLLLALAGSLLGGLFLLFGGAARFHLGVESLDLLLGLGTLLVLHAEGAVLDELGGRRLVLAAGSLFDLLGRHGGRFGGLVLGGKR
jgi:hypothetical protein